MTRIAITGGRDHRPTREEMQRFEELWSKLSGTGQFTVLLHGKCPDRDYPRRVSCDMELDRWARQRRIERDPFPADWRAHGKAAGPIRNGQMVLTADYLIVFPGGDGTADCVRQAKARGVPVYFVSGKDGEG